MKVLEYPKSISSQVWTAAVKCTGDGGPNFILTSTGEPCKATLEIEETDLFKQHSGRDSKACFCCPLCNHITLYEDYLMPDILPMMVDWHGFARKGGDYTIYYSEHNPYHVIYIDESGYTLFSKITKGNEPQSIKKVSYAFRDFNGEATKSQRQYNELKALLDAKSDLVFRDYQFPLNGLTRLYDTDMIDFFIERDLECKMLIESKGYDEWMKLYDAEVKCR